MRSGYWLAPERLFDGKTMRRGLAIRVEGDTISEWAPASAVADEPSLQRFEGVAAPGLIDLQVNGGGNVLLNTNPSVEGLKAIAAAHRALGCKFVFPTLITDRPAVLDQTTEAMLALWREDDHCGILGLHIEGPHISHEKRGTHKPEFIRPMDELTTNNIQRLREAGIPVLVTLAPEATVAGQIAKLVGMGAIVSIGHSAANDVDMMRAIGEGAQMGTHLFNGMSGLSGRSPGVAGHLMDSDLYLGIIADGHHVSETMIRLAWRSRPVPEKMILVSDAMPTVGGASSFELYGQKIQVIDGKLVNSEGSLAGVHMALPQSIARVTRILADDGSRALAAATAVPAEAMGLHHLGHLRPGSKAGITLFDHALNWQSTPF